VLGGLGGDLFGEDLVQEVRVGELLAGGLLEESFEPLTALEQAQALQMLLEALELGGGYAGTAAGSGSRAPAASGAGRPAVQDPRPAVAAVDLDGLADQQEGDRVAVGLDADEPVVGDDARRRRLQAKARLARGGEQHRLLLGEAVDRPLVRGAVDAHIGDGGHPLGKLLVQVEYRVRRTNQTGNLVFPFYFREGGRP